MWPTSRSLRGMAMETMFLASLALGNSLMMVCHFSSVGFSEAGGVSAPLRQPAKIQKAMIGERRFIMTPLFLSELSLASEEIAEELGTFFGQNSGGDFDAMIQTLVVTQLKESADSTGLGIVAAVDEFRDECIDDRAGAHGARFERDDQGAVDQTPVAQCLARFAHGENFGVGGGVVIGFALVKAAADDLGGGEMD